VNLQFITLDDFTPGIRHKVMKASATGSIQPLGVADPDETYRCIALPSGGLGPLPKRTYSRAVNGPETTLSRVGDQLYRIVGFHVTGRSVFKETNAQDYVEFHFGLEYDYDTDSSGTTDTRRFKWLKHRIYEATPTIDEVDSEELALNITQYPTLYRRASFADGLFANPSDPGRVGNHATVCSWHVVRTALFPNTPHVNMLSAHPDPVGGSYTTPLSLQQDGAVVVLADYLTERILQHQGRILGVGLKSASLNPNPTNGIGSWLSNDVFWWTEVNLWNMGDAEGPVYFGDSGQRSTFTQGQMAGYGAIATVSAQELLLVKHRGGAIAVSGDLDFPTVHSFPGVIGSNGASVIPAYTPVGLVYGVLDGGIYAWQGGDTARKLSTYMDDNFWYITPEGYFSNDGKFDVWGDWILVTGNWLYDTVSDSWWLIEDRDDLEIFYWGTPVAARYMYGAPSTFASSATPCAYGWDRQTPASSYRWRSQVLSPTMDRVVDVREINIMAVGPVDSQVTITVFNEEGDSQAEVFNITTENTPKVYKRTTQLTGTCLKLQIDSDANSAGPAPIVFSVNLGVREGQQVSNVASS
jgi:hypothetical protein